MLLHAKTKRNLANPFDQRSDGFTVVREKILPLPRLEVDDVVLCYHGNTNEAAVHCLQSVENYTSVIELLTGERKGRYQSNGRFRHRDIFNVYNFIFCYAVQLKLLLPGDANLQRTTSSAIIGINDNQH